MSRLRPGCDCAGQCLQLILEVIPAEPIPQVYAFRAQLSRIAVSARNVAAPGPPKLLNPVTITTGNWPSNYSDREHYSENTQNAGKPVPGIDPVGEYQPGPGFLSCHHHITGSILLDIGVFAVERS